MFCGHCGNRIDENVKFCGKCGTPVIIPELESPGPDNIPAGFMLHSSGFYYKQEFMMDAVNGNKIEKVIWYNPFTGQFKEVIEDAAAIETEKKNAGIFYVLMAFCGLMLGIVITAMNPKSEGAFTADITQQQLIEEQEANINLVNALREYFQGKNEPIE